MKKLTTIFATSALLLAMAGQASAAVDPTLERDVQWAAGGNSNISYEISGDTITLTGEVENYFVLDKIIKVAEANGARVIVNDVVTLR